MYQWRKLQYIVWFVTDIHWYQLDINPTSTSCVSISIRYQTVVCVRFDINVHVRNSRRIIYQISGLYRQPGYYIYGMFWYAISNEMTENVITQSASHQLKGCMTRQNHVSLITLYTLYHPITSACTKSNVCIERKNVTTFVMRWYIYGVLLHLQKTYGPRKCYNSP